MAFLITTTSRVIINIYLRLVQHVSADADRGEHFQTRPSAVVLDCLQSRSEHLREDEQIIWMPVRNKTSKMNFSPTINLLIGVQELLEASICASWRRTFISDR